MEREKTTLETKSPVTETGSTSFSYFTNAFTRPQQQQKPLRCP